MIKYFLIFIFFYINLFSMGIVLTQEEKNYLENKKVITMCVDPDWIPFETINKNGKHEGIAADIINLISKRLNIQITLIPTKTWDKSLEYSKSKKCDILSFINESPLRKEWLIFTEPIFEDPNVLVGRSDYPMIEDLSKIKASIAFPKETAIYERFLSDFPNLVFIPVNSEQEAFNLVENRKADLTLRSLIVTAYTIKKEGLFNLKIVGKTPDYTNYLRMGVLKDENILRDILNKGVKTLTVDDIDEIVNKHVSIVVENGFDYKLLWQMGLAFFIILILLLYRYKIMQDYTSKIEKYLNLINNNVLIANLNKEGIITDVSEALCKLSGYTKKELIGQPYSIFRHENVEVDRFTDLLNTISLGNSWQGEIKNLNKDGSYFWADVKITTLFDKNGRIKEYSVILENITNKKEIEKLSVTDTLTQIPNRLYLDRNFQQEVMRANRYNTNLSLMIIDIDLFKRINDNYGHKVGDEVLIKLANILKQNIRNVDIIGRWGGEEFLIICPETNLFDAEKLAEKLRIKIDNYNFSVVNHITCSFGVTQYRVNDNKEEAFNRSDKALYLAKEQGRNRVVSIK